MHAGAPGHAGAVKPIRPKQLLRDVGRRAAELRTERGLTQEEFAVVLRISARYLRRIEAGEKNLTLTTLAKLANRLGVPLSALLERPRMPTSTKRGRKSP